MNITANELRELYTALTTEGDCTTVKDLAAATGLGEGKVEQGLEILIQQGLASNSQSCVERIQFETVK